MKLNKYFMFAMAGLAFAACSNENDLDGNNPDGNNPQDGTTYVAFSLDFKGLSSRASTGTTETGTAGEQDITTAYVMLVDNGNISKVVSKGTTTGDDRYDSGTNKYLMTTTAGPHDFYAVVNPDIVPTTDVTINEYFNTAVALNVANVTTDNKFMMSSQTVKSMTVLDNVTADEALAGENNLEIPVERVSAKVTVTCTNPVLVGSNGKAVGGVIVKNDTKFTLKGIANKSYRMKQGTIADITDATYTTTSAATAVCFDKGSETNIWNNATPTYCLENLHTATTYTQDKTTYITLETVFIPETVVKCDDGTIKTNPNYKTDDPETSTAVDFYVVNGGDLTGNYILASELSTFQDQDGNNDKLPKGVSSISSICKGGKFYYDLIWVGQPTLGVSQTAPIDRNTWYNLEITQIGLPGSPDPITPGKDKPLEPATNVAVTLSVLPWNFISKDLTLQ